MIYVAKCNSFLPIMTTITKGSVMNTGLPMTGLRINICNTTFENVLKYILIPYYTIPYYTIPYHMGQNGHIWPLWPWSMLNYFRHSPPCPGPKRHTYYSCCPWFVCVCSWGWGWGWPSAVQEIRHGWNQEYRAWF